MFKKWPGALTIIVNDIRGGTTAFRCPSDLWLLEILKNVEYPLYSTSVNKSGCPILENISDREALLKEMSYSQRGKRIKKAKDDFNSSSYQNSLD